MALSIAGQDLFSEFELTPREHTRYLPIMLESVLKRAHLSRGDIQLIVFGNGPGAFTGVRIAAATAQGLAIGLDVPILGISSLAALAQQACDDLNQSNVIAALDARMGEVYCGYYVKNRASQLVELQGEETLLKLEELSPVNKAISAGSGWSAWKQSDFARDAIELYPHLHPTAAALVKLADDPYWRKLSTSPGEASINYIRNKVAEKKPIT